MTAAPEFNPPLPILGESEPPHVRLGVFVALIAVAVVIRLVLSQIGHNWDMECWVIDADLARSGAGVYANTDRYNYGPLWFLILQTLRWFEIAVVHPIVTIPGHERYHLFVALFLSTVDVLTSIELAKRFGRAVAIAFICSPIGMLISGFHSQCDNTAILLALFAWRFIFDDRRTLRTLYIGGALLALSLGVKHVMLFLPLWLLLIPRAKLPLSHALTISAIAYAGFALLFVPFALTPEARHGIYVHVITYRSFIGGDDSIFARAMSLIGVHSWNALTLFFFAAIFIVGRTLASRRPPGDLIWLYTVALLLLTPAFADQYLAIPLIAIALHWRQWYAWLYTALGTAVLLTSPYYSTLFRAGGTEGGRHVPYHLFPAYTATIWLVFILFRIDVKRFARPLRRHTALS